MATQHPYATPAWLDFTALSRGQLSDDLLLIVDLEREPANRYAASTPAPARSGVSRGEAGRAWRVLGVGRRERGSDPGGARSKEW